MTKKLNKFVGVAAVSMTLLGTAAFAQTAFSDWDTDGTPGINQQEFDTAFDKNGMYDTWDLDKDGNLTETEFNTGVYGRYDKDTNGIIEEPEFGDLGDDMGDGGFWDV